MSVSEAKGDSPQHSKTHDYLSWLSKFISRWVRAEMLVRKYGEIVKSPEKGFPMKSPYLTVADQALETMRKLMVEFGLTPSSRSRIRVPEQGDAASEFEQFLEDAG